MTDSRRSRLLVATFVAAALVTGPVALADFTSVAPTKDNSLFEPLGATPPDQSNGAGVSLFSGETTFHGSRRALLAFDVASAVPAGSTIVSAALRLRCTIHPEVTPRLFSLHKLTRDWGEAGSDAGMFGGVGAPALPGDATWTERFFPAGSPWSAGGGDGDYVPAPSATTPVGAAGATYAWSAAGMVADVQDWLDNPAGAFGWILIGEEATPTSARAFSSREDTVPPRLIVQFNPPVVTAGAVPDGDDVPGTPLTVEKLGGGQLRLEWGASCQSADDYAVYRGGLNLLPAYDQLPLTCVSGGTSHDFFPDLNPSRYYLVVPIKGIDEGSYGLDSSNSERPSLAGACLPQLLGIPVCP